MTTYTKRNGILFSDETDGAIRVEDCPRHGNSRKQALEALK